MAIDKDTLRALQDALVQAKGVLYERLFPVRQTVADLYAGRDGGAATPLTWLLSQNPLNPIGMPLRSVIPEGTANFMFTYTQTISAATFPATPSVRSEPIMDDAAFSIEDQNQLNNFVALHSGTADMMQKAMPIALHNGWAGLKAIVRSDGPTHKRVQFVARDALQVGWEPFLRRFQWDLRFEQASVLPADQRPPECKPWQTVIITEVYVRKFGDLEKKKLTFVQKWEGRPKAGEDEVSKWAAMELGKLVDEEDQETPPLVILKLEEPASGEDVPPAEALNWIPRIDALNTILMKYERMTKRIAQMWLASEAKLDKEQVQKMWNDESMTEHLLWVNPANSEAMGMPIGDPFSVDATLRPAEFVAEIFNQLANGINMQLFLLDRQTGISELQRGEVPGGRQSATEISVANTNAQLRNGKRRERVADAVSQLFQFVHEQQKAIYGNVLRIAGQDGIVRAIPVPDPKAARAAMRVDAVELGHLIREGDLDARLAGHQQLLNTRVAFPSGAPAEIRESLRRILTALGWRDVERYVPPLHQNDSPQDRIQEFLLRGGRNIPAFPDDVHTQFIAEYDRFQRVEMARKAPNVAALRAVEEAKQQHQVFAAADQLSTAQQTNGNLGASAIGQEQAIANLVGNQNAPLLTSRT